ncbi:MAG TPA: exonuclease subunit SbcD [Myxococcales bacterium]
MRILHTSDWHLGRPLEERDRIEEQRELLGEIAALLDEHRVDLLLVAGDVFDTVNPPAAAEQLFYDAIEEMSHGGRRAVVVLAGNHDSPERLVAASPLADRYGISLMGLPGDVLPVQEEARPGLVRRVASGPAYLELAIPGVPHGVCIAALPYPSEARLRTILATSLDEKEQQVAYAVHVARLFADLGRNFRPDAVNLAASHLFVTHGQESGSERPIQLGGACAVPASAFPAGAHYVALGHLHRPQEVPGAAAPTRYSGSPMACSFAEVDQAKSVVLVEAEPGKSARIELLPLTKGRPLAQWEAKEGFAQALSWCQSGKDAGAWIDLEIHGRLELGQVHELRKARPELVRIRPVGPEVAATPAGDPRTRSQRPLAESFQDFFRAQRGEEPDAELVKLFCELAQQEPETETAAAAPTDARVPGEAA